jgi:hypothetical protein
MDVITYRHDVSINTVYKSVEQEQSTVQYSTVDSKVQYIRQYSIVQYSRQYSTVQHGRQ